MKHILKCMACGKYTLKEVCSCGNNSSLVKPAKYSPEDQYGKYRRQAKAQDLIDKGLL